MNTDAEVRIFRQFQEVRVRFRTVQKDFEISGQLQGRAGLLCDPMRGRQRRNVSEEMCSDQARQWPGPGVELLLAQEGVGLVDRLQSFLGLLVAAVQIRVGASPGSCRGLELVEREAARRSSAAIICSALVGGRRGRSGRRRGPSPNRPNGRPAGCRPRGGADRQPAGARSRPPAGGPRSARCSFRRRKPTAGRARHVERQKESVHVSRSRKAGAR